MPSDHRQCTQSDRLRRLHLPSLHSSGDVIVAAERLCSAGRCYVAAVNCESLTFPNPRTAEENAVEIYNCVRKNTGLALHCQRPQTWVVCCNPTGGAPSCTLSLARSGLAKSRVPISQQRNLAPGRYPKLKARKLPWPLALALKSPRALTGPLRGCLLPPKCVKFLTPQGSLVKLTRSLIADPHVTT